MADLTTYKMFNHFRVNNFYERVRVCEFCCNLYNKIDSMRNYYLSKP